MEMFLCPVCFEIPENEIYQCEDGHTLCSTCFSSITQCPQCRVSYEGKRIRCRAIESILDTMTFPCQHEDLGCNVKVKRNDMKKHLEKCRFASIKLCKLIGFNCNFETNIFFLSKAVEHFQSSHAFISKNNSVCVEFHLENFGAFEEAPEEFIWTPIILTLEGNASFKFIIIPRIHKSDKSLTLDSIFLQDLTNVGDKHFRMDFEIVKTSDEEISNITWSTAPVMLNQAKTLLQQPTLCLPLNLLCQHFLSRGSLKIAARLREMSDNELMTRIHSPSAKRLCLLPEQVEPSTGITFDNVSCDECESSPISGVVYKCLQCSDFDLCKRCWSLETHSHHVFAMIRSKLQYTYIIEVSRNNPDSELRAILSGQPRELFLIPRAMTDGFSRAPCDGCGVKNISWKRFICLLCPRMDLCEACMNKGIHKHHIFAVISNSAQEDFVARRQTQKTAILKILPNISLYF